MIRPNRTQPRRSLQEQRLHKVCIELHKVGWIHWHFNCRILQDRYFSSFHLIMYSSSIHKNEHFLFYWPDTYTVVDEKTFTREFIQHGSSITLHSLHPCVDFSLQDRIIPDNPSRRLRQDRSTKRMSIHLLNTHVKWIAWCETTLRSSRIHRLRLRWVQNTPSVSDQQQPIHCKDLARLERAMPHRRRHIGVEFRAESGSRENEAWLREVG